MISKVTIMPEKSPIFGSAGGRASALRTAVLSQVHIDTATYREP